MNAVLLAVVTQAPGELSAQLDRLVLVQTIAAAAVVAVALMAIAVAIAALVVLRRAMRVMARAEQTIQRLSPRAEPILDHAARIAADASEISATIRRDFDDVQETISRASERLRAATLTAENKIREFGVILQVVQEEAEELLLDTAAAARGLHTTAAALRGARGDRLERRASGLARRG